MPAPVMLVGAILDATVVHVGLVPAHLKEMSDELEERSHWDSPGAYPVPRIQTALFLFYIPHCRGALLLTTPPLAQALLPLAPIRSSPTCSYDMNLMQVLQLTAPGKAPPVLLPPSSARRSIVILDTSRWHR